MKYDNRVLGTLLAALRLWQYYQEPKSDAQDIGVTPAMMPLSECEQIATNRGQFTALTPKEIDGLCEQLNVNEVGGFLIWCKTCLDEGREELEARVYDSTEDGLTTTAQLGDLLPNGIERELGCKMCDGHTMVVNILQ